MNDQINAIANLLAANQQVKVRTSFLDVAAGALTTALANTKEHVAELSRQVETRRAQLASDQAKLVALQAQVNADAQGVAASTAAAAETGVAPAAPAAKAS